MFFLCFYYHPGVSSYGSTTTVLLLYYVRLKATRSAVASLCRPMSGEGEREELVLRRSPRRQQGGEIQLLQPLIETDGRRSREDIAAQCMSVAATLDSEDASNRWKQKDAESFYDSFARKPFSQQASGRCMGCARLVTGTGSGRFRDHLLTCPLIPVAVRRKFDDIKSVSDGKKPAKADVLIYAARRIALHSSPPPSLVCRWGKSRGGHKRPP